MARQLKKNKKCAKREENEVKVLLVEDDADVSAMYGAQLELEQHEVKSVGTAQEALDALDEEAFDVVVLDILLPGSNGLAVLQEIQGYEDWRDTPVIVLSNLTSADLAVDDKHLRALGVHKYLIKMETTPQQLADAVKSVV